MSNHTKAIFLSYASQDADTARRICDALRTQGLEVWFDQSELRGGDAWDASIRKQIKECALFVPMISANTNARSEGYFRLEWKLAVDRSHLMADDATFFVPVMLDDSLEQTARVPDAFRARQWSRVGTPESIEAFAARVAKVVGGSGVQSKNASNSPPAVGWVKRSVPTDPPSDDIPEPRGHAPLRPPYDGLGSNSAHPITPQPTKDATPAKAGAQVSPPSGERSSLHPDASANLGRDDTLKSSGAHTNPPSLRSPPKNNTRRNLIIGIALSLVAALITATVTLTRTSTEAIGSIAVLPFQTKSADTDTDYLADGLAETLIYQLSQVPKLKVSPASSAFRFKGKDADPLKVGAELGVAAVMTGRLVQRGESLSISVELVDVRNKKSLWGEKYERKMADLLATQRDIAAEIARKLQLNLSGESQQLLAKHFTDNNEAYQLYLKGQYLYLKRGGDNLARAVEFFQQAVKLDPNFAMAYVTLANTYSIAAFNGYRRPKDVLPLALVAAERALAIDPARAEAHAAKASVMAMGWQWEPARQGFEKAIALNPNVAETRFRYALLYLLPMGRHDEAIAEFRRAITLEPQAIIYAAVLTRAYHEAGKTQLALDNAKKVYAFEPDHPSSVNWLAVAHTANGNYTDALALVAKARGRTGGRDLGLQAGWAYAKTGKLTEAKQELAWLKARGREEFGEYSVGLLEGALGNRDAAFAALERAFDAQEMALALLRNDPFSAPLRGDPRYDVLLKRIGLAK